MTHQISLTSSSYSFCTNNVKGLHWNKGRTIRKVMGGWGKKTKKTHARENAKKKNSCKEEGKEKKFMQKEGPILTFLESLSFFQNLWGSEINNITRHNMNKQKSLSSYERRQLEPCFCFKLQLVYLQHTLYTAL